MGTEGLKKSCLTYQSIIIFLLSFANHSHLFNLKITCKRLQLRYGISHRLSNCLECGILCFCIILSLAFLAQKTFINMPSYMCMTTSTLLAPVIFSITLCMEKETSYLLRGTWHTADLVNERRRET